MAEAAVEMSAFDYRSYMRAPAGMPQRAPRAGQSHRDRHRDR
jgi:hypothetical protein